VIPGVPLRPLQSRRSPRGDASKRLGQQRRPPQPRLCVEAGLWAKASGAWWLRTRCELAAGRPRHRCARSVADGTAQPTRSRGRRHLPARRSSRRSSGGTAPNPTVDASPPVPVDDGDGIRRELRLRAVAGAPPIRNSPRSPGHLPFGRRHLPSSWATCRRDDSLDTGGSCRRRVFGVWVFGDERDAGLGGAPAAWAAEGLVVIGVAAEPHLAAAGSRAGEGCSPRCRLVDEVRRARRDAATSPHKPVATPQRLFAFLVHGARVEAFGAAGVEPGRASR
jgi:hypothetical protein